MASATCAGSSPTGALLSYDAEGRLISWQNTSGGSPTTQADELYDGSGARVEERVLSSGGTTTTTTDYLAGGAEEVVNGTVSAKYYTAAGMIHLNRVLPIM